jgi:hypothetical protein
LRAVDNRQKRWYCNQNTTSELMYQSYYHGIIVIYIGHTATLLINGLKMIFLSGWRAHAHKIIHESSGMKVMPTTTKTLRHHCHRTKATKSISITVTEDRFTWLH